MLGKGWVAAGDLVAGDEVYNLDGTIAVVLGSWIEKLDTPILVYNLEVEDFHSYFVGDASILVHNKCTIINQDGVKIVSNYPKDHGNPIHVHVKGGGPETKIGPMSLPVKGFPKLTTKQRKVVQDNLSEIKKAIKEIQKWIRNQP